MNPYKDISIVILAGGESRRFKEGSHQNKALYKIDDESMLKRSLDRSLTISDNVFLNVKSLKQFNQLISHLPQNYEDRILPIIDDTSFVKITGPLRGILSAIKELSTTHILFQPVDMPYIGEKDLLVLLESLKNNDKRREIVTYHYPDHITTTLFVLDRELTERKYNDFIKLDDSRLSNLYRGSYSVLVNELDIQGQFVNVNMKSDLVSDHNESSILNRNLVHPGRTFWAAQKMRGINDFPKENIMDQYNKELEKWDYTSIRTQIQRDIQKLQS